MGEQMKSGYPYRVIFEGLADEDGHLDLPDGKYLTSSHIDDATRVEPVIEPVHQLARARSVRVPDDEWKAAKRKAAEMGETVTDVIRRALQNYAQPRW